MCPGEQVSSGSPSLEGETPSSVMFMGIIMGMCPTNTRVEGVLKVVRRSRATLIFSMGIPLVKPQAGPGERVSSC